jgi:hypothetical protein
MRIVKALRLAGLGALLAATAATVLTAPASRR